MVVDEKDNPGVKNNRRPSVDKPMHSLLRLSCDAGSQVASHEKHKQVEVAHFHLYQAPHCGLRTPVLPLNRKYISLYKNIKKRSQNPKSTWQKIIPESFQDGP
jgi:hypothetical protein